MIAGIVKLEKSSPESAEVFWTMGKIDKKLGENRILHSVPFYYAGQMWQLALSSSFQTRTDFTINFSILRITASKDETPGFSVVCWEIGILGSEGRSHFGSTGFAGLGKASEWVRVADFSGPRLAYLRLQKDLYRPGDKITIALRLIMDSRDALIKDERGEFADPLTLSMISDFTVINVKDKTFYAENSILDGFTDDIELKTSECITGRMTVIDLPDCHPVAFEFFLSFKDSGEVEGLTDDMAREVYEIAGKFQVPEKKRECVQLFLRTLNVSSVCGFLEMAERYDDQELKEGCSDFFMKNAREILYTSEWLKFLKARTGDLAGDLITRFLKSLTERTNVDLMNAANGLIRLAKSKKPR